MACPLAQAETTLTTEKDKISYVIGLQIGGSMGPIKDEVDLSVVVKGMEAALSGAEPAISQEEAMQVQQAFQQKMQAKREADMQAAATKNKADGEAFLASNKGKDGVKTTESGLQYAVVTEGTGPKPAATDTPSRFTTPAPCWMAPSSTARWIAVSLPSSP